VTSATPNIADQSLNHTLYRCYWNQFSSSVQ